MRTTAALILGLSITTTANAQCFELVFNTPSNMPDIGPGPDYLQGSLVEYSLYMDNTLGAGFTNFFGWAGFSGFLTAPGTFPAPTEGAIDETAPDSGWEGRRPPSTNAYPGGSGGGFRSDPQSYTPILFGLAGDGPALPINGLAATALDGGFLQDGSARLEVFRGLLIVDQVGFHTLTFDAVDAAYFTDAGFTTIQAGVHPIMDCDGAPFTVVPAPASLVLLGLGGLAVSRRR